MIAIMPQANRRLDDPQWKKGRRLRKKTSVAEEVAWNVIRKGKIGFRFRRQHAIGPYVLDFYCPEAMLALEFDGEQHDPVADGRRDEYFAAFGIQTLRIQNREFFFVDQPSRDWIAEIIKTCEARTGRTAWPETTNALSRLKLVKGEETPNSLP